MPWSVNTVVAVSCRPTFKREDAITVNWKFFPPIRNYWKCNLKYYVCGDESRRAQNAIIEFAISLKM